LREKSPDLKVEVTVIKTRGDIITDRPLREVTGKGFFVKEIEAALLRGEIDFAVHSLKDMPTDLPSGLTIAALCNRVDPRDVLVVRGWNGNRGNWKR
jgi:Porphobilinogen deaminase